MHRILCVALVTLTPALLTAAPKPITQSSVVTPKTPGHAVELTAELGDASKIYLVVTDAGNGFACDWAAWIEPTLHGADGTKRLTEIKPFLAQTGFGSVGIDRNAEGRPIRVDGNPVKFGIGVHANSVLGFEIPKGFTKLTVRGGLDDGGVTQGSCGDSASVRFAIYTEKPTLVASKTDGGGNVAGREPENALDGLSTHPELQSSLFAAEPMLLSPTNIDIDHKGRVWVCEVVNYRQFRNKDTPERTKGDRILILEDTDADGVADKEYTFYQGRDIDSAHGVCVLGNRVIVSAGDSVFSLIDDDGDLKADRKEVLFTGISGTQHDHGIHSFLFGPDGRLYFNFGNAGKQIWDRDGKPIVDRAGNEINDRRKPYQEGMIFRCELDGSNVETLAWNFRNNWEVAVDSYGNLWQSDNDDDGNRGVRINFVMEYGNYGYKDELTGAGWRAERIGMHPEIPKRHWHLNDPGVVPNLLQTGAGSPTGIMLYEGDLLPEPFRGELIHCDAGPNIVRAYPVEIDGAGYTAEMVSMLEGTRDRWFRPSDVCAAPDGSLIVADWYDPGVGGHRMQDIQRGRLFRLLPQGHDGSYTIPEQDFSTVAGAIEALKSPNGATRYLAWTALHGMGAKAETELLKLSESKNPHYAARAIWLLGRIDGRGERTVREAIDSVDPQLRIVGLRLARQLRLNLPDVIRALIDDESAAVRRECAIALVEVDDVDIVSELWAKLAAEYDGDDRWMLEALGIAARGHWDACLTAYAGLGNKFDTAAGRDLIWRSRGEDTASVLALMLLDPATPESDLPRFLRAFDFQDQSPKTQAALARVAFDSGSLPEDRRELLQREVLKRLPKNWAIDGKGGEKLDTVLNDLRGTSTFVMLVERFDVKNRYPELLELAQAHPTEQIGVEAMSVLLRKGQTELIKRAIDNPQTAVTTLEALRTTGDARAVALAMPVLTDDDRDVSARRVAVRIAAASKPGAMKLVEWADSPKFDTSVREAVAATLHSHPIPEIRVEAERLFPRPPSSGDDALPAIPDLVKMRGDAKNGRLLFFTKATCNKCHRVGALGKEIGPDLTLIGKKLAPPALYESILYPSAGVSHNYETWTLLLETGTTVNGIITSETPESITIKDAEGIVRMIPTDEIEERVKQKVSLMPAGLTKELTTQELVDVVTYMQTLTKAPKD